MKTFLATLLLMLAFTASAANPVLCEEITADPDGHGYAQLAGTAEIIEELIKEKIHRLEKGEI